MKYLCLLLLLGVGQGQQGASVECKGKDCTVAPGVQLSVIGAYIEKHCRVVQPPVMAYGTSHPTIGQIKCDQ